MLGRTILSNSYIPDTRVSSDGNPKYKTGGVTIDWSSVAALGSTYTFPDPQFSVASGLKMLRYGQILTKETGDGTIQTLTGTATGGTFTITVTRPNDGQSVTTAALAATATAAQILAALQAVMVPSTVVSATGGALGTATVPITFATTITSFTINGGSLTGGTVTNAATGGTTGGYFGPFDPTATDGRQTLTRGQCFILDQTILQYSSGSANLSVSNDQIGGVFDGGGVSIDRIIQSGTASHSLAAGPTLAEFLAAFPAILITQD